jgi:hypothetical protein
MESFKEETLQRLRNEKKSNLTAAEQKVLQKTLQSLREEFEKKGVNLKPGFAQYDREPCRGAILIHQFRSVITSLKLNIDIDDTTIDLLHREFVSLMYPERIDYRAFLKAVDTPVDGFAASDQGAKRIEVGRPVAQVGKRLTIEQAVASIRKKMNPSTFIDHEFFVGYVSGLVWCPSHCGGRAQIFQQVPIGFINAQRFRAIMETHLKIFLDDAEMEAIKSAYRRGDGPDDANLINYQKLFDHVNSGFVPVDVSTKPASTFERFTPYYEDQQPLSLTASQEAHLKALLARLKAKVRNESINHLPFFRDRNRRTLYITKDQFWSVLITLKLEVSEAEIDLLAATFRKGDLINYGSFSKYLDDSE